MPKEMNRTLLLASLLVVTPAAGRPLNDTAVTWSGAAANGYATTCIASHPAGQDCQYGRDVAAIAGTLVKLGASTPNNGQATGFDFTKVSNGGADLPATAVLGAGANDWACTRDNFTGLLWEVKLESFGELRGRNRTYSWFDPASPDGNPGSENGGVCNRPGRCDTAKFVADVNAQGLCGYSDWRLPTVKELEDMTDLGRSLGTVDPEYFPNTIEALYWAANPVADSTRAWAVSFARGSVHATTAPMGASNTRDAANRALLVRGAAPATGVAAYCRNGIPANNPSASYLDHGDGTISDRRAGLMWKTCLEGRSGNDCAGGATQTMNWANALAAAQASTFAGHDDWRLPNIKELRGLVEECRSAPAINTERFPNTPSGAVWSATPDASSFTTSDARIVSFADGGSMNLPRQSLVPGVRLVRYADLIFRDGFETGP